MAKRPGQEETETGYPQQSGRAGYQPTQQSALQPGLTQSTATPTGGMDATQAQQGLQQANQQFLQEIGELASQLQQQSTNPQVKQLAGQISEQCNQLLRKQPTPL